MRDSPHLSQSPRETLSQWPKTALSSRTNVRDLGFLPEFTPSLAEGVEMTKAMFSMRHSLVVEGEDEERGVTQ